MQSKTAMLSDPSASAFETRADAKGQAEVPLTDMERGCQNGHFRASLQSTGCDNPMNRYLVVDAKRTVGKRVAGAAVLPVVGDRIALLRVFRRAIGVESWEIPRGFIETGEPIATSAQRELFEETGLECDSEHLVDGGLLAPDNGILGFRIQLYVALSCRVARPYESLEWGHREMRFFLRDEVARMIEASQIEDASTIVAFYRYGRLRP